MMPPRNQPASRTRTKNACQAGKLSVPPMAAKMREPGGIASSPVDFPPCASLTPPLQAALLLPLMGQQFNKVEKRRRRKAYLVRKKSRAKEARAAAKK